MCKWTNEKLAKANDYLMQRMKEFNLSRRDALLDILYEVYELEFPIEYLEEEFGDKREAVLYEMYLNI